MRLQRGCAQGIVTIKETKNGRPRSVHIVATVVEQLKKLAQERKPNIPFVFPSKKRFGKIAIRKAWEEALARCGIKDLRFHDLRHTFCTYAANSGGLQSPTKISDGSSNHSNAGTLYNCKCHPDKAALRIR